MSISNHPVEQEELMAYLDGELAADRAAETASHLEQCPQCRQLAADLREVSTMLAAWQVEESELDLDETVGAAWDQRGSTKSDSLVPAPKTRMMFSKRGLLSAGGLAVAVLLVLVVSIPSLHRSGPAAEKSAQFARARAEAARRGQVAVIDGQGNIEYRDASDIRASAEPKEPRRLNTELPAKATRARNGALPPSPTATPRPTDGRLDEMESNERGETEDQPAQTVPGSNGPMIVRTADLAVTTNQFDKARAGVEDILKRHHGYVGELNVNTPAGSARSLTGTLRVPASQLDATLSDLKALGRTEKESQGGEEITQRYVDLEARLANSKHTEQRLVEMLRERTGKLSDVLAVEMQISRVRGEIEQMEAERKTMKNQVDYATLSITLTEDYKAELKAVPPSTSTQFRNAAVEGYRSLVDGIIAVLLWLLSVGPTLLVWAAILFFPVKMVWRQVRPRLAASK